MTQTVCYEARNVVLKAFYEKQYTDFLNQDGLGKIRVHGVRDYVQDRRYRAPVCHG